MVSRSERAVSDGSRKRSAKATRRGRQRYGKTSGDNDDTLELQQSGVLNLNNPLIPPELDEDINDDLAFNSDDEEMYGHFFQKKAKLDSTVGVKAKKKKVAKKPNCNEAVGSSRDAEEALVLQQLRALGEIEDDEDLDFHERKDCGDDDNYIDIVDMLDGGKRKHEEEAEAKKKRKKKDKKGVDKNAVTKKRRRAPITEQVESLYGSTDTESKYGTVIRNVVATTPASSLQSRIQQNLANKNNLISVDVDEHEKAIAMRDEVRKVVEDDLAKYKSFLREQSECKHVQLPMVLPKSNPVPTTLGAVADAMKNHILERANDEDFPPENKPRGMGNNVSCVSALRLAGRMNALLLSAGLSTKKPDALFNEDSVLPFVDDDNNNNNDNNNDNVRAFRDGNKLDAPSRGYMAKLKAILSSENARRRRMNRIKSKTYRRILRKEKERENERREKAFELLHPEKARARLAKKLLKARMEERVTQKHKNTSKWVRHAKRFVNFDSNTKDAINEQNLLHQKLMQKMEEEADEDEFLNAGAGDHREDSEAVSSEEERVVDHLIADAMAGEKESNMGQGGLSKKEKLTALLWGSVDDLVKGEGKGETAVSGMTQTEKARMELRQMKFMQQATQREEMRYTEMLESLQNDIRRDMRGEGVCSSDEPSDIDEGSDTRIMSRTRSRTKTLGVGDSNVCRKAFLGNVADTQGSEKVENIKMKRHCGIDAEIYEEKSEDEKNHCGQPKKNVDDSDKLSVKDDSSSDFNEDDLKKKKTVAMESTQKKSCINAKDNFAGSRQPNVTSVSCLALGTATLPETHKKVASTRITILPVEAKQLKGKDITSINNLANDDRKEGEEDYLDEYDKEVTLQKQQEYLIARAFAGDEVDADFLAEKTAQVETIMKPVDKNATLPGWGEWGGADERLNTRHQAKLQAIELQRQIEKSTLLRSRADANLDHVIINHDGVELVPDRMLLHMIPRPFSNPTEFARSMRHPQGPEWNTALTYKDTNQPRVEVRQGHAVLPLDISLRGKKKALKTMRRKTLKSMSF